MKRKNSKRKSYCNAHPVHPDSYMYFGRVIKDKVIGDEYFSVDI